MAGPWEDYASDGPWAQYKASPAPSGPPPSAPKRSGWDAAAGALANIGRGTGFVDELQGATQTAANILTGKDKLNLPAAAGSAALRVLGAYGAGGNGDRERIQRLEQQSGIPQAFQRGMTQQRAVEDQFAQERPNAAALARGTGGAASVVLPVGAAAQAPLQGGRLMAAARGAVAGGAQAGVYGMADRGSGAERLQAAGAGAVNPIALGLGAVGGAIGAPKKALPTKAKPATPQQTLQDAGVFLTPGQKVGGLAKNVEDLAQRAPILGPAISSARQRGNDSLNRVVALKVLEPIGEGIPASVKTGHEAVEYVADRLGRQYDEAARLAPRVDVDNQFMESMGAIAANASELPPDMRAVLNQVMQNRVVSRMGGPLDGALIRQMQKEIGEKAAKYGTSADAAQRDVGQHLEEVSTALGDLMGRASPEAGALIGKANEGWRRYVVLRAAAAKSNKGGIATPGQLSTAVRTTDRSVGKGNVAKGNATMQDLTGAASEVMPDQFGNPGTANAVGLGGLLVGLPTAPVQTLATAGGLTAAATPYFLMGRKVLESLPPSASRAELQAAQQQLAQLAQKDPSVARLQQEIAARLARAGGLLGVASQAPAVGASSQ